MAEFCKECFEKDNQGYIVKKLSKDLDLCEGCGQYKQVVIKVKGGKSERGYLRKIFKR